MTEILGMSQKAFDLIISFEVSSQKQYEARYRRPIRPGGQSGITIGIGYDCGYSTAAQIKADWGGVLPPAMVVALQGVAGLKGEAAQNALAGIKPKVDVPWGAAIKVFADVSLPKYVAMTAKLPNYNELPPDCKGALVSLVYNRGASFSNAGARYQEMRNIKAHMAARRFSSIPVEFRSMKRLWTDASVIGLQARRDKEADLFAAGLKKPVSVVKPPPDPAPIPPQPSEQPSFWAAFLMAVVSIFRRSK